MWHDFTKAEAWEVFPETEPVIKVHVHMSQAACMRIVRLTFLLPQTLRSNGIKVAVVSNFDERLVHLPAPGTTTDSSSAPFVQPLLLKNLGLDHLFDVVLPSCYAGVAKPDPDIFFQVLRRANVEGSEAVHVGDDYKKDYRGAKV